jgi:hypothetical protein
MAGFLDAIPVFNPYVQQLPVEAMVQVGVAKQQAYEQNVTKIQTEIDRVAGLDIMRGVDKEYLQSKMNALGNRLTLLAGGDFSNFQLANSVTGMAGQVSKDKFVQNAVSSTAWARDQQKKIQTARQNGKSSIENEWWFNNDLSNWLNDGEVGKKFSGEFVEYTDMDKKLREIGDKVKELDNSIDVPYKRDNAGNVLYYKRDPKTGATSVSTDPNSGGTAQVDDAMLRIKTKGKPAQKILDNFYTSLSENDKRQLMITGNYHYRNANKETFKSDITSTYKEKEKMLSDYVVNLSVKLKTDTGLTDVQKKEIETTITNLNNKLKNGDLKKEEEAELNKINNITNIDDYKYQLYTQKYLTNLAKDISYQSVQQEYLNNPYAQMDMEKQKLQFQYDKARQEHSEWMSDYNLKVRIHEWDKSVKAQEALKNLPVVLPGAIRTDVAAPTLAGLDNDIKGIETQIKGINSQYGALLFPDQRPEERQKSLNGLLAKYNQNPNSITNNAQREYLDKVRGYQVELLQKGNLFKTIQDGSKVFDDQLSQFFKTKGGVNFKDGRQIYSAEQLYNVASSYSKYYKPAQATAAPSMAIGGLGVAPASGVASFDTNAFLAEHKGRNTEPVAIALVKKYKGQQLTETEKLLVEKTNEIKSSATSAVRNVYNNKLQWQSDELARRMPEYQTMQGALSKDNKEDMGRVQQLITRKLNEFSTLGAVDVYDKSDFVPSTISELLKKTDVGYSINKNYDGSATLTITSGDKKQTVPMNATEFAAYFPKYAVTNPVTNIKYAVLASPNKTTNVTGTVDPVNAYISGYSLPGIASSPLAPKVRVDVEGSANNDGSAADKFQVRLYYNTNDGWKNTILNNQGYVTEDGVQTILENIGPNTIQSMLKY